jgi:hypothetical protein
MKLLASLMVPGLLWAMSPRRILVATWAPEGGPGKTRLQHGRADADDFAEAFVQLGGVAPNDRITTEVSDSESLVIAWAKATDLLDSARSQGFPVELIVFHTGHADPKGLLLGATRMSWNRVRQFLDADAGTTRIAFLDACASGSALRSKGGRFHTADEMPATSGRAILASSRSDEMSTESDKDGGSLFSRALISGLRGGADANHDGQVTLSEIFQYASRETERRAKGIGAPSQHPSASTELTGAIDPVLTDLRNPPARLRLEPGLPPLSVRDSSGRLMGNTSPGMRDTFDLVLVPGLWTLWNDSLRSGVKILLRAGETRWVSPLELMAQSLSDTIAAKDTSTRWVPINFGILPPVSVNGAAPRSVRNAFSMDLVLAETKTFSGFQFAGVMARAFGDAKGAQLSIAGNTVTGNLAGFQFSNANQVEGRVVGAQLASYLNLIEGDLRGVQLGGLMNVARGRVGGAQIGIGSDYAGSLDRGLQVALVTVSGRSTGIQTGIVNVASRMDGVQAGLVNVGSGSGVRVGLLNIVPSGNPYSLGALSLGEEYELHPAVQFDPDGSYRVLLRSRMDWFQSGLEVQGLPYLRGKRSASFQATARLERFLAGEMGLAWNLYGRPRGWTPDLVAGFGWPLLRHLSPFVQARWSLETKQATLWSGVEF